MKMKFSIHLLLPVVLMIVGITACQRRPLEDPDFVTKINLNVKISAVANVTCKVYNDKIPAPEIAPEVMRVLFYDIDKDKLAAESFISDVTAMPDGNLNITGDFSILPGEYRMLCYQLGTEITAVSNYNSYESSYAYTEPVSDGDLNLLRRGTRADYEGQTICYQPDHIVVARSEHESIPYHSGSFTIFADAESLVESYYLQVKIDGLQWVNSARAVLTSMASSVSLASSKPHFDEPCAIYIPLLKSDDKGVPVVCNTFNTFGRIPDSENILAVTFDILTVDGRKIEKTFDISPLFDSPECQENHWLLVEETIVIPEPPDPGGPDSGGLFNPVVDDWEEEHHDIEL